MAIESSVVRPDMLQCRPDSTSWTSGMASAILPPHTPQQSIGNDQTSSSRDEVKGLCHRSGQSTQACSTRGYESHESAAPRSTFGKTEKWSRKSPGCNPVASYKTGGSDADLRKGASDAQRELHTAASSTQTLALTSLTRALEQCSHAGWDGYDARAVSDQAAVRTIAFLNALPSSLASSPAVDPLCLILCVVEPACHS
jgi:hypothetical protein